MKHFIIFTLTILAVPTVAQWKNVGYEPYPIYAFGLHDSTLFLSTPGHLYRYKEGEADAGIDFTHGNVTSFATLGPYFYCGLGGYQAYRSSNNGSSWTGMNIAGPVGTNGQCVFAGYGDIGVARSRDGGNTWDSITNLPTKAFASIGNTIFANTGSQLWRSKDTGNNWTQLSAPFAGTMTVMDSLLFVIGSGKVIESTDLGLDWVPITVDTAGETETVSALVTDGKNLFAGTSHSGILLSRDSGTTWKAINDSLPISFYPLHVTAMGVFDTLLFADLVSSDGGTYNLFVRSINELADTGKSGVQSVSEPPADTLEVYPNPATGLVTIRSGSAQIEQVSVINLLGVDVLDLPNLRECEIAVDISKLPSGTYFLRIETVNGSVLRKVIRE